MNKLLLCAYHLRKLRPASGDAVRVHILTDDLEKFPEQDCRRMFAPWAHWMQLDNCRAIAPSCSAKDLGACGVSAGHVVIALCEDNSNLKKQSCKLGAECIVPEFPPMGTFDNDLVREVSFFDHEFGGVNEWDGAPTRYAINCIQQMSSMNCRQYYPSWAFEPLPKSLPRPLKVMDIGCGPVSMLRWGAIHGEISITGLDPLIEMYTLVLARHGLDSLQKIRCDQEVNGVAEDMGSLLANQQFDLIYTQNALDHTQQPALVVENVRRQLSPQGLFAVQVATREGTRQNWDQLHKTDIYLKDGVLMYARQDSAEQPLLPPSLRLKHVHTDTTEWLAMVIERQ